MGLVVVTPPSEEPVTTAEAEAQCRLTSPDPLLALRIQAAREWVETFTRRALTEQELQLTLDAWPEVDEDGIRTIELPRSPLIEVEQIRYRDAAGDWQTLDEDLYEVLDVGAEDVPGRVVPANGQSWPTVMSQPGSIEIDFTAGFGEAASVPARAKQAMLLLIADMNEHREVTVTGTTVATIRRCEDLLWSLRVLKAVTT